MFFEKKPPQQETDPNVPAPPWENIDKTKASASTGRFRFNLMEFMEQATGFGKLGTRLLMLGFAVSIGFVSYAIYFSSHLGPPPPPDMNRPAMDKYASTTRLNLPPQP